MPAEGAGAAGKDMGAQEGAAPTEAVAAHGAAPVLAASEGGAVQAPVVASRRSAAPGPVSEARAAALQTVSLQVEALSALVAKMEVLVGSAEAAATNLQVGCGCVGRRSCSCAGGECGLWAR